jgi:hypothetical protein
MREVPENIGAGEGNRTLVFSLEGCCSTIELHPRAADQLSRQASRLNRHERIWAARTAAVSDLCSLAVLRARGGALNTGRFGAYTEIPSTTKGGDPVSYTKRCHLAGIAR